MNPHSRRSKLKIEAIMNVATQLFEEYGYEKVSVDEIAKNAKTSKTTLYKYFESKEKLYLEVINRTLKHYNDACEKIIYDACDFKSKLTNLIKLKLKYHKIINNVFLTDICPFNYKNEQLKRSWELHQIFHNQGRKKGFISDEWSDEDLNDYFEVLIYGTIKKYDKSNADTLTERKIESISNIVYYGILKRDS